VSPDVLVLWDLPNDNFEPITDVEVRIADGDGAFAEHTDLCDASAGTTAFENRRCMIPMDSFGDLGLSD
jgi:hypothetical protein